MEEMIIREPGELERQKEAQSLHQYILAQGQVAAQAVAEIGRSLKEMRDRSLYRNLGHETFEEYTEEMLGIKQRQAYNYIQVYEQLGPRFVEEHASLGVSKLLLLAGVPAMEREEAAARAEDLTVRQLRELTEKYDHRGQQLSLLTQERDDLAQKAAQAEELRHSLELERQRYRETEEKMLRQLRELEDKPVEVAVRELSPEELEKIRGEESARAAKEAKAKADQRIAQARAQAEKELEEARKRIQKEQQERADREIQAIRKEQERAAAEARQLEKKLAGARSPDALFINFAMESIQAQLAQVTGRLAGMEDREEAEKFRAAVCRMLAMLQEQMEEERS